MPDFKIHSPYQMAGDQPEAVAKLVEGINNGLTEQTLMGVTGSGKTFTMANIIEQTQRPTLVLAHNKTLAAQLCTELREFFPENAVEYFVILLRLLSAGGVCRPRRTPILRRIPPSMTRLTSLRHSATAALSERETRCDHCVFGVLHLLVWVLRSIIRRWSFLIRPGMEKDRDEVIHKLIDIQYARNDIAFERNRFRVRGDTVEIWPVYSGKDVVPYRVFR